MKLTLRKKILTLLNFHILGSYLTQALKKQAITTSLKQLQRKKGFQQYLKSVKNYQQMTYPNKESIRIPMGVNQLKITEEKKLRINESH